MSSTRVYTTSTILKDYFNNNLFITSTKLDSTLKAIINSINKEDISGFKYRRITYLNILRLVYSLKRIKYYNYPKYREIKGKYY